MTGPISPTTWDVWAAEGRTSQLITDKELELFARHIPDRRGWIAVDAGCGTGSFSRQLRALGYNVTGLDSSPTSLRIARRSGFGPGLSYLHHDLEAGDPLQLPAGSIDLVVCRQVLPFLTDPGQWLERVRTHWLRPGGFAYLVIPVGEEDALQRGQMTWADIVRLAEGWKCCVPYELGGSLACLILRSPAT